MILNKGPRGFLELLGLKAQGANPTDVSQGVIPTMDVTEFYGTDLAFTGQSAAAVGAFELVATEVSGPNRLLGLGFEFTSGALFGLVNVSFGIRMPASNSPDLAIGTTTVTTSAAIPVYRDGRLFPNPFVVPAGTQLWARAQSAVAGADHSLRVKFAINSLL